MTFTGYVNDVLCTNRATNEPDFRDPITKKNKPLVRATAIVLTAYHVHTHHAHAHKT